MLINIDYKLDVNVDEKLGSHPSNQFITNDYINFAINQKYPQGLEGQKMRIWGRLQRKLSEGVEKKLDQIELEEAEKDIMKDAFRNTKFPTNLAKYVIILEDVIDKL